jgi:hypothetical protein
MTLLPHPTPNCVMCGKLLTRMERYYLEYRCEVCEGKWHERLQRWKAGGDDAELDQHFAALGEESK